MLVRKLFIERLHIPTCHESKTATISHTAGKHLPGMYGSVRLKSPELCIALPAL